MNAAVERFSLPLTEPLKTARGTVRRRRGFLFLIKRGGDIGVGEAAPLEGRTEDLGDCRNALETAANTPSESLKDVPDKLRGFPAARHAVEESLLDLEAKETGEPLYRHLGSREKVNDLPVNAVIGDGGNKETGREAEARFEEGFGCLKLKAGLRTVDEDLRRVEGVRKELGSVELRVDANASWNTDQATRAIDGLSELGVDYVEQPLPPGDLEGLSNLRGRGVDIAADESLAVHDPLEVMGTGAADVLVLKPMVLGGPGVATRIGRLAREEGVESVVTTSIGSVVGRTGAVHAAAAVPCEKPCGLATADLLESDLGGDPAPVLSGRIRVPQDPGLGLKGGGPFAGPD